MNEVIESIFSKAKEAYKESVVVDNDKLQDLLIAMLADIKRLENMNKEAENNILSKDINKTVSTRYTYDQVKAITKIQVKLAKEIISLRVAEEEILKVSSTFPVHNLRQYNKRMKSYLSGIGEHGFAFPSNWARALLKETNNNPLVVKAFRQQQALYLEKENRINRKLEDLLDSL